MQACATGRPGVKYTVSTRLQFLHAGGYACTVMAQATG